MTAVTAALSADRPGRLDLSQWAAEAVLLDLDGTLINTLDEFDVALAHMLRGMGLPPVAKDEIARIIGKGSEHLVRSVLALALGRAGRANDAAAVEARFADAMARYYAGYGEVDGQLATVFPGALDGLRVLHGKGIPMAVVTNKPLRLAEPLLATKGLAPWVQFLYGGDSFEKRKPDPYPLLKACERLGSSPARTLMIGDSSNDALAARAAGCPVVLMRYGFNHGLPIETVDADGYFDSIDAIARQLPARPPAGAKPGQP
ncbi:phosphoglycolate phosphatase [Corticibacter populi]|uniref:Phosphoglycolate phosphatase n=1 Tax=Corticibacter populi TaxID=1550736 RepID=A0A3M6QIW9_9BURK|nr:phosphoglycolate phosphatase [Corticibacter populi]RMX03014.1 phosphoglycolate phosphatase [Corticibacter populi]RZS33446.1 phosphoglycolate phosphatase [Corticibacter populi]